MNRTPLTGSVRGGKGSGGQTITLNAPLNITAPIYSVEDLDQRFAGHTQQLADAL